MRDWQKNKNRTKEKNNKKKIKKWNKKRSQIKILSKIMHNKTI